MNYLKIIIFLLLSSQLYAQKTHKILQTKNYKFNNINPDKGLLENTVQTIFQDSQGTGIKSCRAKQLAGGPNFGGLQTCWLRSRASKFLFLVVMRVQCIQ